MNNKKDDEEGDNMSNDDGIKKTGQELAQCPACLRRMCQEVFIKHPNVCRENPVNKRNIRAFDMVQYRSIRAGDKIIPVRKVSPINANKLNNHNTRPSQTRSAKRDRRSDSFIPPVINKFFCPTCKRTFCEKAYDRHVTFCSSKIKQIQQPPSEEILLARLKLNRRIKFGSNRISSTLSNPLPVVTTSISTPTTNKETKKQKSSLPTKTFCYLPIQEKFSNSLARCPWCLKPYMPNCIHYCRNSKELFSIHSQ